MSDYRIVGTFNVTATKTLSGSDKLKIETAKKPEKPLPLYKAREITAFFSNYQPINTFSTYSEHRGAIWGNIKTAFGVNIRNTQKAFDFDHDGCSRLNFETGSFVLGYNLHVRRVSLLAFFGCNRATRVEATATW